ncbi:MAG: prepilin-type N-terminal cleavage/methylation domain-containing protein [Thermodesulfobacteria bacterium]|nr:prepilin-type N-terminal cleavage/methylation domain-containing protein [Thermodesulfobacteriota bacterium]
MESNKVERGFTLVEVLVVLILVSLLFSVILLVFKVAGIHGIIYEREAEKLRNEAFLFYELKHQLESSQGIEVKRVGNRVILEITTPDGESVPGIVDACYIYANQTLYYEEKLHGLEEKDFCTLLKNPVARVLKLKIRIRKAGKIYTEEEGFKGIPDEVRLTLDDVVINAKPKFAEVLK